MDLMALKATLSLDSSQYDQGINAAGGKVKGFSKVGAVAFGAFMEAGRKAANAVFSSISSNMDGAIKRFDTLNNFTNVMTSIGFGAEEADRAVNGLATGIEKLPTTLDAVARQAQMIAPITKDIGEAKDITLALNNALAAGGVSGAAAEGAITQWVQAMAKGKPDYIEWMRMVQSSPAQMDQLAKSMLGASAGQADLFAAIKDGSVTIDDLNKKMVELSQNDFEIDGKHFDSWAKQAEKASAGIQMATLNVKAAMQRNIANTLDAINEKLGDSGISDKIQSVVPAIDLVGSRLKSMISGDLSFEDGITSLMNSLGNGLRNAADVGGGLITNILEGMSKAAPSLVETAQRWIGRIFTSISGSLPGIVASGAKLVGGLVQGFSEGLPRVVDGLTSMLDSLTSTISENATSFIGGGLDIALSLSEKLRSGAGQLVDAGMELIKSLAQGIADSLPAIIETVPQIVTNIAGIINDNAPKLLATGLNIIITLASGLIQAIPTLIANIPQILAAIWNAFMAFNWIALGGQVITAIGNGLKALGESLPSTLRSIGQRAWDAVKTINWHSLGSSVVSFITNGIRALASLPFTALRSIASAGMRAFTGISWGTVGSNIVSGIARGVAAAAGTLFSALKNLAKNALKSAKNALGIKSPSRVFRKQVGKNIGLGMALGIEDSIPEVNRAIGALDESLLGNGVSSDTEVLIDTDTPNAIATANSDSARVSRGAVFNYEFNVYGTPNQSPREIAEQVRQIIITDENRRRVAWV